MIQLKLISPTPSFLFACVVTVLLHILVFSGLVLLFPMTYLAVASVFASDGGGVSKCAKDSSNFLFCVWSFYAFLLPFLQALALCAMRSKWNTARYRASLLIGTSPLIALSVIAIISLFGFLNR